MENLLPRSAKLQRLPLLMLMAWALLAAGIILWSMWLCDGRLVYTLDDPYIHLAVADKINAGGYGVNLGEYSSPCSSVLFPFILAGTELAGLGMTGPLFINVIAMAGVVYLIGAFLRRWIDLGLGAAFVLGMLLCANINAWGLVMTGMEHSLHLLMVALVMAGLVGLELGHEAKVPWWLAAAIVVMPLIRFEGAAMSAAALVVLWFSQRRLAAVWIASLMLVSFMAWGYFMSSHGLPILPSSVQMKSSSVSGAMGHASIYSTLSTMGANALQNVCCRQGIFMLLIQCGIALMLWLAPSFNRQQKLVGWMVLFSGFAHLLLGRYGWFSRYEIYLFLACLLAVLLLVRPFAELRIVRIAIFTFPFLASAGYVYTTFRSPVASRNIYEQQYQMRRFAQELWLQPVAVNDLGLVSYRNPAYVLDLSGLGSEKMRKLVQANRLNSLEIQNAVAEQKIGLVMIYDTWFRNSIPSAWVKVATLKTSKVTAAEGEVAFYATNSAAAEEVRRLLPSFAKGLPSGASLAY